MEALGGVAAERLGIEEVRGEEAHEIARVVVGVVHVAEEDRGGGDLGEVADAEMALVVLDGIFDCADIEDLMVQSMMEDGTPEDQARCVAEGFGEDELRSFMEMAVAEDEPDDEAGLEILFKMFELAAECGLEMG